MATVPCALGVSHGEHRWPRSPKPHLPSSLISKIFCTKLHSVKPFLVVKVLITEFTLETTRPMRNSEQANVHDMRESQGKTPGSDIPFQ